MFHISSTSRSVIVSGYVRKLTRLRSVTRIKKSKMALNVVVRPVIKSGLAQSLMLLPHRRLPTPSRSSRMATALRRVNSPLQRSLWSQKQSLKLLIQVESLNIPNLSGFRAWQVFKLCWLVWSDLTSLILPSFASPAATASYI
jgi:hypothetical protein